MLSDTLRMSSELWMASQAGVTVGCICARMLRTFLILPVFCTIILKGKEAVVKKQSIKCGSEYFVQLRKPSREPNAPWRITQWGYMHHIRIPAGAFDQPAAGSPRLLF